MRNEGKRQISITEKQRAFCEEYVKNGGNVYKACISAGYSPKYANGKGYTLLRNVQVKAYIEKLMKKVDKTKVKSIEEIQEFWGKVMDDPEAKMQDRLKASENLAKVYGAFININKNETTLTGALDVSGNELENLDDEELQAILSKLDDKDE